MSHRTLGAVMIVCGFFLSVNSRLATMPRALGILLAIVGALLMIIKSSRAKGTRKK